MRVQSINLNLIPVGVMPVLHFSQFDRDVDGSIIYMIYNGSVPFDLTNCEAVLEGTKPDSTVFSYPCTVHNNFLTTPTYSQMTSVLGDYAAEIRISKDGSVVGTLNFIVSVEVGGISTADLSNTEVPTLLDEIQNSVDEAEYWAEQAASAVTGVSSFNGRHGSVLPVAGDYDSKKILLASALHIGGETQSNVQEALEALSDGSGHTILNGLGQEMPQRKNLRFAGANVSDDAENDTTNVTITGGGSGGSTITVTTTEISLYGESVIISDGVSTFTGVFDSSGVCVIDGVTATGTLTITSGAATNQLNVPYYGNYTTFLSFWAATINVTTDPDIVSAIVKKDGVQIGTVNFTSGSGTYIAGSTGAYTFEVTVGGISFTSPTVTVTEQTTYSTTIDIFSAILNISTSASSLYGKTITIKKGSTTVGTTAFSAQGSASYTVHETGTYTCECEGYSGSATVSAETTYNVTIDSIITYHLTVDIYSAASDTLSYTDDNGAQTVTTDSTGKATGVSITITQTTAGVDPSITFTSSVAKDPTNPANAYSPSISIAEDATELYIMPNNGVDVYYWFGYHPIEFTNLVQSGQYNTPVNPTYNTNNVYCIASGATSGHYYYSGFAFAGVSIDGQSTIKTLRGNPADDNSLTCDISGITAGTYYVKYMFANQYQTEGNREKVGLSTNNKVDFSGGTSSDVTSIKYYVDAIWIE